MTEEILVVGGGFAGFWAARAARRVAGARATVTLLSREPVLQMRPRLYERAPETLGVDLLPPLGAAGVRFIAGEAAGLDTVGREVTVASGYALRYDRLVVATGSRLQRPGVPGADSAWSIDTQREAIAFDRRLRDIAQSVAAPAIAVVGAGFTGIELALELRDRLAVHGGEALAARARIVLLGRGDSVGDSLGDGPRPVIEAALAADRIEVRLAAEILELSADSVTVADAGTLRFDAVVVTTGMVAAAFADRVPGRRDALRRIVVDDMLRAPAAPEVFVAGDSAAADTGDGRVTLQSCQHALQTGRFAGENAARDLLRLPLLRFAQPRYVTCLDLGRSGAVLTQGWERNVAQTGDAAKALKRRINQELIYPPTGATGDLLRALSSTDPAAQRPPAAVGGNAAGDGPQQVQGAVSPAG